MKLKISRRLLSLLIALGILAGLTALDIPAKAAAAPGTPYNSSGTYDVTVPHVIINQIYGGYNPSKDVINAGADTVNTYIDKGQAVSHSFIELYNPTGSDVNLNGWSVQYASSPYCPTNLPASVQNGKWAMLSLTGTIPAHSSYLIRGAATGAKTPGLTLTSSDQDWSMPINTKGIMIALMSNTSQLSANTNPFNNITHAPSATGYVDMLAVNGNDSSSDEMVFGYEGSTTNSQSKQKAIRRIAFQDTDNNAAIDDAAGATLYDTQVIGYNSKDTNLINWAKPRTSSSGAWYATTQPYPLETTALTASPSCLTNSFGSDPTTTRTFTWETTYTVTSGTVYISTGSSLSSINLTGATSVTATASSSDGGKATTFRASTTGLTPGTTYYYIASNGSCFSPVYSFKTEAASASSFSFLHISDTQSDDDTYSVSAPTVLYYSTWGNAVRTVTQQYHPDFLLETGDIVDTQNNEDQWRWYFKEAQDVLGNYAMMPIIGNHDESANYPATAFGEHFTVPNFCSDPNVTPGTVYSFDYGAAHFVILNSECKGAGFTAQHAWAAQDMANTHQKFIIVALHRGMYGGTGLSDTFTAFGDLLDTYNVALVLQGHDHAYIRTKLVKNGTISTDGTGSISLETGGSGSKQDSAPAMQSYMDVVTTPGAPCYSVITVTNSQISVHTVVVQNANVGTPTIVPLQSAGTGLNPSNGTVDFNIYAAPSGFTATAPTTITNNDGIINGSSTAMEYRISSSTTWVPCTGSSITGLSTGTYNIRYKAGVSSDTYLVSSTTVMYNVPAISSVSPASGNASSETNVTITGTNFVIGGTSIKFGTLDASKCTVNSTTQITATAPAESADTVDITVMTPGGTSAVSSADKFQYVYYGTASGSSGPAKSPSSNSDQTNSLGTASTSTTADGRTATTITLDTTMTAASISSQGNGAVITIPATTGSPVTTCIMTGGIFQTMSGVSGTFNINSPGASYILPANLININAIAQQFGTSDSNVQVSVTVGSASSTNTAAVQTAVTQGNFNLVAAPVSFEINCTVGSNSVPVSNFNSYVERTIAMPSGFTPNGYATGVVLTSSGTLSPVPTIFTMDNGIYYAHIRSLTNSTYAVVSRSVSFPDVTAHWAKDAIIDMGSRLIITGYENGKFLPNNSMTRAEFATIIVRALGLTSGTYSGGFKDVQASDWFSGYIQTAVSNGLIKGNDDVSFAPNDTITREQAMAIIARAIKLTGLNASLSPSDTSTLLSTYADNAMVSSYAADSIAACIKTGIINGSSANTLAPQENISRAEVAVIAERLLQKSNLI